ncbi:hypothetical protein RCL1_003634 [Eukaryota sp. TZLM3-RCL]
MVTRRASSQLPKTKKASNTSELELDDGIVTDSDEEFAGELPQPCEHVSSDDDTPSAMDGDTTYIPPIPAGEALGEDDPVEQDLNTAFETWNPDLGLQADEELAADTSAYLFLHQLTTPWPSYSVSFLPDKFGMRTTLPTSVTVIAGTQAPKGKSSSLFLLKCQNIHSTTFDGDEDREQDIPEDDEFEGEAQLTSVEIPHNGGVNKLLPLSSQGSIVATTSEDQSVYVYQIAGHLDYLNNPVGPPPVCQPIYTSTKQKDEGFALEWCNAGSSLSLLSGCCKGFVYQHVVTGNGIVAGRVIKAHNKSSVESISVNPVNQSILATSSCDGSVKLWDLSSQSCTSTIKVSKSDINVCSILNDGFSLVTGDDDGGLSLYDLRNTSSPLTRNNWIKRPITSISRTPSLGYPNWEQGAVVTADDGSVTVWDFSIESEDANETVPCHLLFNHVCNGQAKDAAWHPQVPGALVCTSEEGLSIFKPRYLFDEE